MEEHWSLLRMISWVNSKQGPREYAESATIVFRRTCGYTGTARVEKVSAAMCPYKLLSAVLFHLIPLPVKVGDDRGTRIASRK